MTSNDPIKHVVVLMLENHSFDQILGCMRSVYKDLEGIDEANLRTNTDPVTGNPLAQAVTDSSIDVDPHHEHINVMRQIGNNCGGFLSDFVECYRNCSVEERTQIMGYFKLDSLPVIHTLARSFTICDHWFSSMPGPTWPNRFFVHSGTCKGHVLMPSGYYVRNEHYYDQKTIYDLLEEKQISWSIYHHGMPHSLLLERLWDKFWHFHRMENFFVDARGAVDKFPAYSFIEPSYGGTDQNDQHPPTDIRAGEILIAQVYNALRSNAELWNSTLLVLLYDEHGGFYDHVVPPSAIPPDSYTKEYAFNQYGLRVPAILISPWVERGFINTVFDHTSLLKYLIDKWELEVNDLGARVATANTFASALTKLNAPRSNCPAIIDIDQLPHVKQVLPQRTNTLQDSLVSFGHFLEGKMSHVEELAAIGYRSLKSLEGPLAQLNVAKDRFVLFLHHGQKDRLGDVS